MNEGRWSKRPMGRREKRARSRREKRRYYVVFAISVVFLALAAAAAVFLLENNRENIRLEAPNQPVLHNVGKHLSDVWAAETLEHMSLEEKICQMFLVRCPEENAAQVAAAYPFGGYILFARDFANRQPQQMKEEIASYQRAAQIDMLICVDEEGGSVNRVSRYSQYGAAPFQSPQRLYQEGGWERIISDTVSKADFLKNLGINVNMAPVCDVTTDPSAYMYERAFGQSARMTAIYAKTVAETMKEKRIGSVLKHFPGYGNNTDTHTAAAVDERSYEEFQERDFLPFKSAIEGGADAVLVSHTVVTAMDDAYPASLSPRVHQILRQELGFEGVIITDDLVMAAAASFASPEEVAVMAVEAGNDMLCCTDYETQILAVYQAVQEGRISLERIDESVQRILKWKYELGVIPPKEDFRPISSFFQDSQQWPVLTAD